MTKTRNILFNGLVNLLNIFFKAFNSIRTSTPEITTHQVTEPITVPKDVQDLDKEYAPHMWSPRFPSPEEVLQHHINFSTNESEKATETIPHQLDIKYGSTPGQKLDILGTDLPNDAPILVYFHGGYWQQISREISRFPANSLHRSGIKTIVIGHDLCPEVSLWDVVDQVEDAAIYVFKYAERMGSRGVYLAGHCAGAHLIAKVLSNSEIFNYVSSTKRLNGVFLISGIYDLRNFVDTSSNDVVQLAKIDAVSFSPLFSCTLSHLEDSEVRFFIIAGDQDSPTFKKQSRDFFEFLCEICATRNMHMEIKDDMDHYSIVECYVNEDNYLKNLILHDICKHC